MVKKIGIQGMAKSGTTALYSAVKAELPTPRRLLFEPNNAAELRYITAQQSFNALTKLIFSASNRLQYDSADFTHNVAIVRDPRDIIVSSLMFRFNRMRLINNKKVFQSLLTMLEAKEKAPKTVDIVDILNTVEKNGADLALKRMGANLKMFQDHIDSTGPHVVTYDQMIGGDLGDLNAFLGLNVNPPPRLEGWVKKISRKGTSGDWKNWLTETDVAFYSKALNPFIERFGFNPEWTLNEVAEIEPEHCSQYVRKLAEMRMSDPNLEHAKSVDEEALGSAAEDSKSNALIRIYELHHKSDDAEKVRYANECAFKLGQLGYPKYAVLAGQFYRKNKTRKRAIRSFKNAIQRKYPPAYFHLGAMWTRRKGEKYDAGLAVLRRGAKLGSKKCKQRLVELKAAKA